LVLIFPLPQKLKIPFMQDGRKRGGRKAVVGKHPDLMVGPTNDRNFEISQFFAKNFEKV
jgi:hypothetical protein